MQLPVSDLARAPLTIVTGCLFLRVGSSLNPIFESLCRL